MHESRGAVFGVDEWLETDVFARQLEYIDRPLRCEAVDRAPTRALVVEIHVAPADAIELVLGVQADPARHRFPLENVRVDVELVSRQIERHLSSIGELEMRREQLSSVGLDSNQRCGFLACQRSVSGRSQCHACEHHAQRNENDGRNDGETEPCDTVTTMRYHGSTAERHREESTPDGPKQCGAGERRLQLLHHVDPFARR